MCEMMSKGSKEALTLLIVIHVTHVNVTLVIQASEHAQKIASVEGIPTSNFMRTNLISFVSNHANFKSRMLHQHLT